MRLGHEWQCLRQTDWRQLELAEAGDWPLLLRCLLVGLVFVVALLLGRLLLVTPQQQLLQLAQSREVQRLSDFQQLSGELASTEPLAEYARALEQRLAVLQQAQQDITAPALVERIGNLAAEHQLGIESLELQMDGVKARRQSLQLSLVGSYHHMAEFIGALADMPVMVSLHDLVLTRRDGWGDTEPDLALRMAARVEIHHISAQGDAEATTSDGRSA